MNIKTWSATALVCLAAAGWAFAETQAQLADMATALKAAAASATNRTDYTAAVAAIAKTGSPDEVARILTQQAVEAAQRTASGGQLTAARLDDIFNGMVVLLTEAGITPDNISGGMRQAAKLLAGQETAPATATREGQVPTPYLRRVDLVLTGSAALVDYGTEQLTRKRNLTGDWISASTIASRLPPLDLARAMARAGASVDNITQVLRAEGTDQETIHAALYAAKADGLAPPNVSGGYVADNIRQKEFAKLTPPETEEGLAMLLAARSANVGLQQLVGNVSPDAERRNQITALWNEVSAGADKNTLPGLQATFANAIADADSRDRLLGDKAWFTQQTQANNFELPLEPTSAGPAAQPGTTAVPFVGSGTGGGGGSSTVSPS